MRHDRLETALEQARRGRRMIPFRLKRLASGKFDKTPLVPWQDEATTDEATIRAWWKRWPSAYPGWVLDPGTIVADLDDAEKFGATGHELPDAPTQATPRGGAHYLYASLTGKQTTNKVPGLDTRVGGKGWVGIYGRDAFAGDPPPAPAWLVAETHENGTEPARNGTSVAIEAIRAGRLSLSKGDRDNDLASIAGTLVSAGASAEATELALELLNAAGAVEQPDGDQIGPDDFRRIARSIALSEARKQKRQNKEVLRDLKIWTFRELLEAEFPYVPDRVEGMLPSIGFATTIAAEKAGKSLMHSHLGLCIAAGVPFMGHKTVQCPVLVIEEEGSALAFQERLEKQAKALALGKQDLPISYFVTQGVRVDDPAWIDAIEARMVETGAKVCLMGPLAMLADIEDENKAATFNRVARELVHLAARNDAVIQLAHHRRKDDMKVGPPKTVKGFFDSARGSSALMAAADAGFGIQRDPEEEAGTFYLLLRNGRAMRSRVTLDFHSLLFDLDESVPTSTLDAEADEYDAWLIDRAEWVSRGDAAAKFGTSKNTAAERLERLVADRRAERKEDHGFKYRATPVSDHRSARLKTRALIDRSDQPPINDDGDRSSEGETGGQTDTDQDRSPINADRHRSTGELIGRKVHRSKDGTRFRVQQIRKEKKA